MLSLTSVTLYNVISMIPSLLKLHQRHLNQFHHYHNIFKDVGIHNDFNLPGQHSLQHYIQLIWEYNFLNGICSSITENKHMNAVKEPWRRLSKWQMMCQMLISNQCMDKLVASHTLFKSWDMLKGTCLSDTLYQLCEQFDFPTTATTNWCITLMALMKISPRSMKKTMMMKMTMTTISQSMPLMFLLMFNWQKQLVSGYMSLDSFSNIINSISTSCLHWSACYEYQSIWPSSPHLPVSCLYNWTQLQHLWVRPLQNFISCISW